VSPCRVYCKCVHLECCRSWNWAPVGSIVSVSTSTTLEVDTLTIAPIGAHNLQHSRWTLTIDTTGAQFHDLQHWRWTHLQLTPQGLISTTYNTRGGHTYNRPHRGSRSTTLEMDTLKIDLTGAQFHDLTTLEVDTLTIDPIGAHDLQHSKWTLTNDPRGAQFHDLQHSRWTHLQLTPQGPNSTTYNTRGGHTYNRPHRGSRSTTLEVDTLTIDPTGVQFHDLQHWRWIHLQLTPQGLISTTYNTRGGHVL
jgi:hypothetical protein